MNQEFKIFVAHWHEIVLIWAEIAFALAILNMLLYAMLLASKKKITVKFEFLIKNEIKFFWISGATFVVSLTLFLNALIVRILSTQTDFELISKTFVTLILGFGVGYALNIYLRVFYPFKLEKKLQALRFRTRFSQKTGKPLRLLTEDEEDVHLTEDMIEHELSNVYEYDVWIDDSTGEKLIEKYPGRLHQIICEKCNYRTAKEVKEEILEEPDDLTAGKLKKVYECYYCGHIESRVTKIAPLSTN